MRATAFLKSAKEQIPLLSERYLKLRNRQMSHKAAEAELNLAIRRGDLISKELVTRQAAYLMVILRQRLLNLPVHAHKLVGLDADGMRKALREIAISYAVAEFEWGDTAALKEHLESHVTYPATGKVIKESCKSEMPDEFAKQQRAYLDSKLKDDTTYKNPEEVFAALNLK